MNWLQRVKRPVSQRENSPKTDLRKKHQIHPPVDVWTIFFD